MDELIERPLKRIVNHWEHVMAGGVVGIGQTPETLWNEAVRYFSWCDQNPIYKNEVIRSGKNCGDIIQVPIQRPYTISGLCLHLGITRDYLVDVTKNQNNNSFFFVAKTILEIIHTQKLEGVYAGLYSPVVGIKDLKLGMGEGQSTSPVVNVTVEGGGQRLLTAETEIEIPEDKK